MQKPIDSALLDLSVATPMTRPAESNTGPPEFPGLIAMLICKKSWPSITVLELITPRLIAFSSTTSSPSPGLPITVTSSPLTKRYDRATSSAGRPLRTARKARSRRGSSYSSSAADRPAMAGRRRGEADLQVGEEFVVDHVGVGRDEARADEEAGPARDAPLDQGHRRLAPRHDLGRRERCRARRARLGSRRRPGRGRRGRLRRRRGGAIAIAAGPGVRRMAGSGSRRAGGRERSDQDDEADEDQDPGAAEGRVDPRGQALAPGLGRPLTFGCSARAADASSRGGPAGSGGRFGSIGADGRATGKVPPHEGQRTVLPNTASDARWV